MFRGKLSGPKICSTIVIVVVCHCLSLWLEDLLQCIKTVVVLDFVPDSSLLAKVLAISWHRKINYDFYDASVFVRLVLVRFE